MRFAVQLPQRHVGIGRETEDRHVSVFVRHIDLVIDDQRRGPDCREHVVSPMTLPRLRVETMHEARQVTDDDETFRDGDRIHCAVHCVFELFARTDELPDECGVGIGDGFFASLRIDRLHAPTRQRLVVGINSQLRTDITAFGRVDAGEPAGPFALFHIPTGGQIHAILVDDRIPQQRVANPTGIRGVKRLLGVDVEFPELLTGHGIERAHPAVALRNDYLHLTANLRHSRAGELCHEDVGAGGVVLPIDLARLLVEAHEVRSLRLGHLDVIFADAIVRRHKNPAVPRGTDRTGTRRPHDGHMREDVAGFDQVQLPQFARRSLAAQQRADVQTKHLAAVGRQPKAIPFDQR